MATALQKNIRQQLAEKHLSVHAFEKKAGLRPSAVQNILQGKSKRPGADLLLTIATELNCTVEDLLQTKKATPKKNASYAWSSQLYVDCLKTVQSLLDSKKLDLQKDEVLKIVDEVYIYSLKSSPSSADQKFADWLITYTK